MTASFSDRTSGPDCGYTLNTIYLFYINNFFKPFLVLSLCSTELYEVEEKHFLVQLSRLCVCVCVLYKKKYAFFGN